MISHDGLDGGFDPRSRAGSDGAAADVGIGILRLRSTLPRGERRNSG
jgi:hypothetical protein